MMKTATLTCLLLAALAVKSHAQEIASTTLRWSSSQSDDVKTGSHLTHNSIFITRNAKEIEWLQRNGSMVQRFEVVEVQGEWEDIAKAGKVTFIVAMDQSKGTVVFERLNTGVYITVDFSNENAYGIRHKFIVDEVKPD
jgi:hypothetical protein